MIEFDKIHLIWRKGQSARRHSVGILERKSDGKHSFKYSEEAKKLNEFTPYPEFQDINKEYNGNVAEIFGQRLTKLDRPDIRTFLDFWEVDPSLASDKFYLLGKTQGLVATDNFEFLAEYELTDNTHFLTEIAGLSHNISQLKKGDILINDVLRFKLEPQNEYDEFAVKVFKDDLEIGYIKKYHNKLFYQSGAENLKLSVKALEQNGVIKRVFIKICNK